MENSKFKLTPFSFNKVRLFVKTIPLPTAVVMLQLPTQPASLIFYHLPNFIVLTRMEEGLSRHDPFLEVLLVLHF